jgi:AraC-like DNA-binding protein
MKHLTRKRSATSVLLMINVANKYGISRDDCLNDTGLTAELLADSHIEISPEQELKLIENLVDQQSNQQDKESLAVAIGEHYHLTTYGMLGFAISTSPTVRSAIEVGLNYLPLTFAFSQFRMTEEQALGYMVVDADHIPEKVRRFVVERDMTAMLCMHREIFGQQMPLEGLEFQWKNSTRTNVYQPIYSKEIQFQQAENRVIFQRMLLDLPLPTANQQSRALFVAQCQDLLQQRHRENSTALKVRNHILANIDKKISMDDVADKLCVSLRTLRRQLINEETSFRALTDEVRETLAVHLIQETALTMEQIAVRLGYSDTANFYHAFKRWTGHPPKYFRK